MYAACVSNYTGSENDTKTVRCIDHQQPEHTSFKTLCRKCTYSTCIWHCFGSKRATAWLRGSCCRCSQLTEANCPTAKIDTSNFCKGLNGNEKPSGNVRGTKYNKLWASRTGTTFPQADVLLSQELRSSRADVEGNWLSWLKAMQGVVRRQTYVQNTMKQPK